LSLLVTRKPPLTKALYFDGASGYVSVTPPSISGDSPFTFEFMAMWLPQPQRMWIMDFGARGTLNDVHFLIATNAVTMFGFWGSIQNSFSVLSYMGVWAHYATTYNPAEANKPIRSYVNGVKVDEDYLGTTTPNLQPTNFRVGYPIPGESYFRGYIAFIRVYSRALSQSEILHNMRNPNKPVRSGLVVWLDARNVIGNTWYDLSGYGNNGAIYGATQVSIPNPPGGW